jgi:multidrug efflux pump subunit AcrA (membrane-fusion protein)
LPINVDAFPQAGVFDLARRVRMLWCWVARRRLLRAQAEAEAELGWLAWEQADYFDVGVEAEVAKVREFETAQAQLLNSSAQLSSRKLALDEEFAREQALHDQTQQALASEREPVASQHELARATWRQKLGAIERFDRALDEIADNQKRVEARSDAFISTEIPDMETRIKAREAADELLRLTGVRAFVIADKAAATEEAARLEPGIAQFRAQLDRIDSESTAAAGRLEEARRNHASEVRLLERSRKKSEIHMARLDGEKWKPYRRIGECLADQNIPPRNQPEVLEKVLTVRLRRAALDETIIALRAASAAVKPSILIASYLLLAVLVVALSLLSEHLLQR